MSLDIDMDLVADVYKDEIKKLNKRLAAAQERIKELETEKPRLLAEIVKLKLQHHKGTEEK